MAITAMGLGTKAAPEGANLDPQREFWSWLAPFVNPYDKGADSGHHERGYFSGFDCAQTDPAGMSIKIGGGSAADSALLVLTDGRCVLLSTNGEPELVTIPTAPATGSRIDAVVSYIDTTSPVTDSETPGTPEYVHTIVVQGTAASNPSAPTDDQIVGALPAGANSKYYRWCDVRVAASQTVITNGDITDKKPMAPNVYSASVVGTDDNFCLKYPNGIMVAVIKQHVQTKVATPWGNGYCSGLLSIPNFAQAFTSVPTCVSWFESSGGNAWLVTSQGSAGGVATTTHPALVQLMRPNSSDSVQGNVCHVAIGSWK